MSTPDGEDYVYDEASGEWTEGLITYGSRPATA